MRDLSCFGSEYFDFVTQGVSINYVPDVRVVFREVARVLRPGGWYQNWYENPAVVPMSFDSPVNGWNGAEYCLTEPYRSGPIRMRADGVENMDEGELTGEFRHLLSDIFGGLIDAGLCIRHVAESDAHINHDLTAEPGSSGHMKSIVGLFFTIVALKSEQPG